MAGPSNGSPACVWWMPETWILRNSPPPLFGGEGCFQRAMFRAVARWEVARCCGKSAHYSVCTVVCRVCSLVRNFERWRDGAELGSLLCVYGGVWCVCSCLVRNFGCLLRILKSLPLVSFAGLLMDVLQRLPDSYLVDPASSHMLVSKIKPCMSKYKLLHSETANGSLNQLWFLRSYNPTWITVAILELIHANQLRPPGKSAFIRSRPIRALPVPFGDSG